MFCFWHNSQFYEKFVDFFCQFLVFGVIWANFSSIDDSWSPEENEPKKLKNTVSSGFTLFSAVFPSTIPTPHAIVFEGMSFLSNPWEEKFHRPSRKKYQGIVWLDAALSMNSKGRCCRMVNGCSSALFFILHCSSWKRRSSFAFGVDVSIHNISVVP